MVAHRLVGVKHARSYFVRMEKSTEDEDEGHSDLGQLLFVRRLLEIPAAKMAFRKQNVDHLEAMTQHLDQMCTGPRFGRLRPIWHSIW